MKTLREHSESEKRTRLAAVIVVLLCGIPILATIAYGAVDSWAIGLLAVVVAIIVSLWMSEGFFSGELRYSSNVIQLPVIALAVLAVVQLLPLSGDSAGADLLSVPVARTLSLDPYATRLFLVRMLIFLAFFAAALAYIPGGSRPKRIAMMLIVFGGLAAFFGIIQRLMVTDPDTIYGLRKTPQAIPFGTFVNQHHFAALMEMTSGLALGLLFGSGIGRDRKIFIAIAAGIMGMAVAFTGSRGGMISYLGVVVFVVIASFARSERRVADDEGLARNRNVLIAVSAVGLVLLVIGSVSFLGGGSELLRGIGVDPGPTDATSGRSHFWDIAWKIFLENPIIGAGFDAFGVAFTRHDTWNGTYRVEQVHNDYLQMLSDGGVLAFVCVVSFVGLLMKKGIAAMGNRSNQLSRSIVTGALAGCFGIMIHSFFDFPLRTTANGFVFLLLVVLATDVGHGGDAVNVRSQRRLSSRREG